MVTSHERHEAISRLSTPQALMYDVRTRSDLFSAFASQMKVAHDGESSRMQAATLPLRMTPCGKVQTHAHHEHMHRVMVVLTAYLLYHFE